jgi:uncharacterized DUF497 family protein
MDFEWDEAKRHANLEKHGVDFVLATQIFDGPTVEIPDERRNYGALRIGAYGIASGIVLFVIYTLRGNRLRLISAGKAGTYETDAYHRQIAGQNG